MLRRIRIIFATLFFLSVTALFIDSTGMAKEWLGWTAKIQFLPALLALNVVTVLALVVLTLLVGRAYCSVICPLGVMQDVISRISGLRKKKKSRFSYSGEKKWLRYGILVIFVVALVAGLTPLAALLAPYSSYGRMVSSVVSPSLSPVAIVAAVSFVVVAIMSWLGGRTYCNTICPVGTVLGFFSRFALFRPIIDTSKCNSCKRCAKKCKASCIDAKNHRIDYSRCVACMDCIKNCKHGALTLRYALNNKACNNGKSSSDKRSNENTDSSRRSFLTLSATLAATSLVKAQEKKVDGGLAAIEDKKNPERATRLVPPGAKSLRHFSQHCTACQLCVSECPNNVLHPSTNLDTLMQPEMSYEDGYCRPECTRCSEVCPAGAIRPITVAEKSSTRIGHAVWIKKNCLPVADGVECGNCARHCPSGAIFMVHIDANDDESPKIPVIDTERCIGCGACENLCPARPFSAIYVEGHERHGCY